jgi:RNA polymerase II subunit A small phosphatase-like protein
MKRPLLILDLDETLMHAAEAPLDRAATLRCGPYFVYERPFAREFCERCALHYELAVWTSSTAAYARIVVEEIVGHAPLSFLWSRERCVRRFDMIASWRSCWSI